MHAHVADAGLRRCLRSSRFSFCQWVASPRSLHSTRTPPSGPSCVSVRVAGLYFTHTHTHEVLGQRVTMLNFRRLLRRSYSLWELGSGTSSYPCYRYSPSWHPQSFITLLRGWRPKTGPGWVTLFSRLEGWGVAAPGYAIHRTRLLRTGRPRMSPPVRSGCGAAPCILLDLWWFVDGGTRGWEVSSGHTHVVDTMGSYVRPTAIS